MRFKEEPSQFSVGQTAIMEKPHTGLDDCLSMLLSCFRKWMSGRQTERERRVIDNILLCPFLIVESFDNNFERLPPFSKWRLQMRTD